MASLDWLLLILAVRVTTSDFVFVHVFGRQPENFIHLFYFWTAFTDHWSGADLS